MSDDINRNKLSDKHRRRADHIKDRLEDQGLGQDHAEQEAVEQAYEELGPSAGGKNSSGDAPKHANHENDHRHGSDKHGGRT